MRGEGNKKREKEDEIMVLRKIIMMQRIREKLCQIPGGARTGK